MNSTYMNSSLQSSSTNILNRITKAYQGCHEQNITKKFYQFCKRNTPMVKNYKGIRALKLLLRALKLLLRAMNDRIN